MKRLVIALVLACAACADQARAPTLAEMQSNCGYRERPFSESWPCMKKAINQTPSYHPDIRGTFMATGDFVAAQVSAGKMTQEEAVLAMAQAHERSVSAAVARQNAATSASAPVDAAMIGGIMSRQPAPARQPVNCYWAGNVWTCI